MADYGADPGGHKYNPENLHDQPRFDREELMEREEKLARARRSIQEASTLEDGIQSQIESLSNQFSKTQAMFSELINRLEPILTPDNGDVNRVAPDRNLPQRAMMVVAVEELHDQMRRLQYRIGETIERVAL